jgi:hypothetical protein
MSQEISEPIYERPSSKRPNALNANWKLDSEGDHIYRVLPAFGSLAASGQFSKYEALHWGISLSTGKKSAFRCIQRKDSKTKMITQECPMCAKMAKVQKEVEERKKLLDEKKVSPDEAKKILTPQLEWLECYNLQKGHYVNVMRPDGQIGRLFIKIKCKQSLDITIKKLITEGYSPAGIKGGVWLNFERIGMGRNDTTYQVHPVDELVEVNGKKLKTTKEAPLTPEILERMKTEAWDLGTYYKDLSYNEIQMLVSSEGDPAMADSILGAPAFAKMPEPAVEEDSFDAPEEPQAPVKTTNNQALAQEDAEEAAALAALQAIRDRKSGSVAKKAGPIESSPDDFLEAFKSGKL